MVAETSSHNLKLAGVMRNEIIDKDFLLSALNDLEIGRICRATTNRRLDHEL